MCNISQYSNDVVMLENIIRNIDLKKYEIIDLANDLIEFIEQGKKYYLKFTSFSNILKELNEFIKCYSSINFNLSDNDLWFSKIRLQINKFLHDLKDAYTYNFEFKVDCNLDFLDKFKDYNSINRAKKLTFNILICYEKDIYKYYDEKKYDYIIQYEYINRYLFDKFTERYYLNYQLYFLYNSIKRAKKCDVKSIATGLSYGMFGINEFQLEDKCKNLCLSSQDLFYAYTISQEVIKNNSSIQDCYICLGYYSLYFDLSSSINEREKIQNIYYPILEEKHHYVECKDLNIFDLDFIEDNILKCISKSIDLDKSFYKLIYECGNELYFNDFNKRKSNILSSEVEFKDIDCDTNIKYGSIRAEQHNKLIHYYKTREENIKILEKFIRYLNDKNVSANIVLFPFSSYYMSNINKNFKIDLYNIFDYLKERGLKFRLLDLNNNCEFNDDDFIDYDHLSELGAKKATEKINDIKLYRDYNEYE